MTVTEVVSGVYGTAGAAAGLWEGSTRASKEILHASASLLQTQLAHGLKLPWRPLLRGEGTGAAEGPQTLQVMGREGGVPACSVWLVQRVVGNLQRTHDQAMAKGHSPPQALAPAVLLQP